MTGGCVAVNFKKQPTNGLHECELLASDLKDQSYALENDEQFDHIALVQTSSYKNCAEILKRGAWTNDVYYIVLAPSTSLQVYCDMVTSGGGWTVIQKRLDGSVDFNRGWADYKRGFGNKFGEYWLGLDAMHALTSQGSYRLRVDLEDFEGNTRYAEYDSFYVADEADNYRLTVGKYSGDAKDALAYHNNMKFSTKDRDNDRKPFSSCAVMYNSAWWYNNCLYSQLNGPYLNGTTKKKGVVWFQWKGYVYSLKRVEMKIRPQEF
ncbi:hypothetical protein QZH41_009480 [Actinostola sp. cb2023]|nr:hypothetical protein QZH41_009480 [Actinostola sp. cb2023]